MHDLKNVCIRFLENNVRISSFMGGKFEMVTAHEKWYEK